MGKSQFPEPMEAVVATLVEIFRRQGNADLAALVEAANAQFEEVGDDNWNGGTTTWKLRLRVPIPVFASKTKDECQQIEGRIKGMLENLGSLHPNDPVCGVLIAPANNLMASVRQGEPSDVQVKHIWGEGYFRVFLSHLSTDKYHATQLKERLANFGVAAFVAHEDVEPTKQWQEEIELALRSMHALAAIVTPGFHESKWTNQEIGWALGRGVPILPVKLGADPAGFIGRIQAIPAKPGDSPEMALKMLSILASDGITRSRVRQCLVQAFRWAGTWASAKALCSQIEKYNDFTEEEKNMLREACGSNDQVRNAYGVCGRIYSLVGELAKPQPAQGDSHIPF